MMYASSVLTKPVSLPPSFAGDRLRGNIPYVFCIELAGADLRSMVTMPIAPLP